MALPRNICTEIKPCNLSPHVKRGMNPKKLHEVCHIASLINDIATKTGCDVVVDVGSGLVSSGFLYFLFFVVFCYRRSAYNDHITYTYKYNFNALAYKL